MFAEVLTGIALVKKSVDFIKENLQTAKDIGELAGEIDNLLDGKQQLDKKRYKKSMGIADQFGVKTVASSVIDQKLAAEELYNISVLIDMRFGSGTWRQILAERNKRIEAAKEAERERRIAQKQQQAELMEIAGYITVGLGIIIVIIGVFVGFTAFANGGFNRIDF